MSDTDSPAQTIPSKCAHCQGPMDSPVFCDHCRSLYPAEGLNYFELLGLPPAYDVDQAGLRRSYLQISRGVHPDHHGEGDTGLSLRVAAQLNEAYRVLADPVLRAEYLLELVGGKSAKDDKNVPPEVLANTLRLREEIQEAKDSGDAAAVHSCQSEARELHDEALVLIGQLARNLPGSEDQRCRLRGTLNAIKYYHRLLDNC